MKPFLVHVDAPYSVDGVIPPRCRKPRSVTYGLQMSVEIARVSAVEAPVVIEAHDDMRDETVQWRLHGGQLWRLHRPHAHQTEPTIAGDAHFPADAGAYASGLMGSQRLKGVAGEGEARTAVEEFYSDFLIVDDVVHETSAEPCYRVGVLGLGGNHGGTTLSVCGAPDDEDLVSGTHFNALEFEAARVAAIELALGRGDTHDVPNLRSMDPELRVLEPEAVRFVSVHAREQADAQARAAALSIVARRNRHRLRA